eukprot:5349461-Prymnesium_polylepis.1
MLAQLLLVRPARPYSALLPTLLSASRAAQDATELSRPRPVHSTRFAHSSHGCANRGFDLAPLPV